MSALEALVWEAMPPGQRAASRLIDALCAYYQDKEWRHALLEAIAFAARATADREEERP